MSDGDTILCQDLYQVNVQKLTVDDNSKEKQNQLPSNENDDVTVEHEEPQFGMMNELFPETNLDDGATVRGKNLSTLLSKKRKHNTTTISKPVDKKNKRKKNHHPKPIARFTRRSIVESLPPSNRTRSKNDVNKQI